MTSEQIQIIYDGDCPFCTKYVNVLRLRENFHVQLDNARERPDLVAQLRADNIDLSQGFVVAFNDRTYHGADALVVLSGLTTSSGVLNRVFAGIFRNKRLAYFCYPIMKLGRRLTLTILGRRAEF